jgi:tetratricopeptide (TPR) repeat protein
MENLAAIVNSLSPAEANLIRHFYKFKSQKEYSKRSQLFELLSGKEEVSEKQAAKLLGYSSSNSSFTNIKGRLRADLLNILLMQEASTKFSTPYAQALFDCRRMLMQGEILINRGVYEEALDLLQRSAKIAQKYEFFSELIQIDDLVRNHVIRNGTAEEFVSLSASIRKNYETLGELLRSKQNHYEINMPGLMGVHSFDEYKEKCAAMLVTNSNTGARSRFYNGLSALNYFSSIHDFDSALKQASVLLKAAESDPVVMSKSNQAGIHMDLANIYLNKKQFDLAVKHSQKSVDLFKPGMINQLHAYIILFFSHFRNGDFSKANLALDHARDHRLIRMQQSPVMNCRLHLLRAGLAFSQGDLHETSEYLRESSELMKDKEGWMPGYFLLESLMLIEKKEIEVAIYKIEAFRKMLYRWGMDNDEHRIGIITRLLKQIVRGNCDYRKLLRQSGSGIRQLSDNSPQGYWDPAGYEIIRFDEWLMKKVS